MIASLLTLLVSLSAQTGGAPGGAPGADTEEPTIEDVAAAASSPAALPVVTVMISDRGSGVGTASVRYRAVGSGEWLQADLKGGTSGLFIARLPDGLQKSGFDYYVEATDVAGNGPARIGSPEAPLRVSAATEGTAVRLQREQAGVAPSIHPGWLMLSLGVGLAATAGAGAYAIDLAGINDDVGQAKTDLATTGLSDDARAALVVRRDRLQELAVQDSVIATVLGVVGIAVQRGMRDAVQQ